MISFGGYKGDCGHTARLGIPACTNSIPANLITDQEMYGSLVLHITVVNLSGRHLVYVTVPSRNQILFQFFSRLSALKCTRR